MKRIVDDKAFRNALNIPLNAQLELSLLGAGEYNINYSFIHPVAGKKLVLRLNTASQMHLPNQIEYEYDALKLLECSGRTPKALYVDNSRTTSEYGLLVMEHLQGRALNYETDLKGAAEALADIHSVKKGKHKLIAPDNPMQAILDECYEMFANYYINALANKRVTARIDKMLKRVQHLADSEDNNDERCIINTELNSGNFLVSQQCAVIDWEKPLYALPWQDIGHFLAPTTTLWKTDVMLSQDMIDSFIGYYAASSGYDPQYIVAKSVPYVSLTCLRGITWCCMAWIEYQKPDKAIKNEFTFNKIKEYMDEQFLNMLEKMFLNYQ